MSNLKIYIISDDIPLTHPEFKKKWICDVLKEEFSDEEDDEKAFSPSQYLEDNSFNPELTAEQDNWEAVNHSALIKNISNLDRRSQDIVRARWLDDNKLTLNELAEKYSISAERIRQIESKAFKQLKTALVNV